MNLEGLKSAADVDVAGRRVLVRVDLNVPMSNGSVSDATRIERVAPGLAKLAQGGAKVVVLSHFGRPKGEVKPDLSLKPVADALGQVLGRKVVFIPHTGGRQAEAEIAALADGDIAMLENLRFDAREEKNDAGFASELAACGDIYVGDAFSCSHRAHASTEGIARILPAYAGPLMMEEINALRAALEIPQRPTMAIVGGSKVSTKIPVLTNLAAKVDKLVIGGGMANTFLQAQGVNVGRSLAESDHNETARSILAEAAAKNCEIILPVDVVVADDLNDGAGASTVGVDAVPDDRMILDVGPASVEHLKSVLQTCRTLLWNGPVGAFEFPPFGEGTFELARAAALATRAGQLVSVAGGGDTVAALNTAGVTSDFSYVSTAGGAFLEWLEGRELPGVAALAQA